LVGRCNTRGRGGVGGSWGGLFGLVGIGLVGVLLTSELGQLPLVSRALGMGVEFLVKRLLCFFFIALRAKLKLNVLRRIALATTVTTFLTTVVLADVSRKWVGRELFGIGWVGLLVFLKCLFGWREKCKTGGLIG